MSRAETICAFRNLFDRKIHFASLESIFLIHPHIKDSYNGVCCPHGLSRFHLEEGVAYNGAKYRERLVAQVRHYLLEHGSDLELTAAALILHRVQEPPTDDSKSPNASTSTTLTQESNPPSSAEGSKGALPNGPLSVYKRAIESLCDVHVKQVEQRIQDEMIGRHQTTCDYTLQKGPIQEFVIAHIHKASEGCFSATGTDSKIIIKIINLSF
jgi:hypothetical protein